MITIKIHCEKNLHLYSFITFKTNYCYHYAEGAILQWSHFLFTNKKLKTNKVEKTKKKLNLYVPKDLVFI